jgi:hypothetical protein
MQYNKSSVLSLLVCAPTITAFAPSVKNAQFYSSLKATVDPETITKKEFEDICGINFDQESLQKRLERTSYLYPKHVEVVGDLAPIVDEMVDKIVSSFERVNLSDCMSGRCQKILHVILFAFLDSFLRFRVGRCSMCNFSACD